MITIFVKTPHGLVRHDGGHDLTIPPEATWIDLSAPTRAEEKTVEGLIGIDIPTREEMQEIETSSRLRQEDGALYMTVQLVANKVHRELKRLGGIRPPREFVLMDRSAVGLGSVFMHLKAEVNWYRLFQDLIAGFELEALRARQSAALAAVGL